jgi:hypothetical protein
MLRKQTSQPDSQAAAESMARRIYVATLTEIINSFEVGDVTSANYDRVMATVRRAALASVRAAGYSEDDIEPSGPDPSLHPDTSTKMAKLIECDAAFLKRLLGESHRA